MPNRLANETSPYLLQHKDNPVDWYPWGEEAIAKARAEDKPILLSVGYSACHWCHVMAHESFEDPAIAKLMNDWFVNVKVDREERPDVDGVYMTALQAMTGSGGWPMTVFMTTDGKPFYTGTYFPPSDGHGRPGFPRVLEAIHTAWVDERPRLLSSAEGVTDHLIAGSKRDPGQPGEVTEADADAAVQSLRESFDPIWGGFGAAPKFPNGAIIEFLLSYAERTPEDRGEPPSARLMALHTLQRMAQGGMYDHIGGGFSRYSVDQYWLVPHFEKMLYDNAQLACTYLSAYQVTGERFYSRTARETLDYLIREMTTPEGGFYSAQDADSEGIEGKYFVWTPAEVGVLLGEDAELFSEWHGVTSTGNFQDPHHPEFGRRSVLSAWRDAEEVSTQFNLTIDQLEARISELQLKLRAARDLRVKPGLDDKVLTSWNGLALAAFARGARVLGDEGYLAVAVANAAFVRRALWRDNRLLHTYKEGVARVEGMLDDYAFYGLGLVELYKATGDLAHLGWARELLDIILRDFRDEERGGFFDTSGRAETLIFREKSYYDSATPGGNSATALLAAWLGRYYAEPRYEAVAAEAVHRSHDLLLGAPSGFGVLWQVAELLRAPHRELVIVGPAEARAPFEREAAARYLPWLTLAPAEKGEGLPILEGRGTADAAVAYLCEDMVCGLPATTSESLASQFREK